MPIQGSIGEFELADAAVTTRKLADGPAVYASAFQQVAQSIPNSTEPVINFDTVENDTNAAITTGAAWHFTAPRAGVYDVDAVVNLAGSAAVAVYVIEIFKNSGTIRRGWQTNGNAFPNIIALHVSAKVRLAAGDTLDVRVEQVSGGPMSTQVAANFHLSYIDIVRIPFSV